MAKTRVFSNPGTGSQTGVYHVVSRFVDRRKVFGDDEREAFRSMMGAFAAFHQVEILTFCLMGNHFHLLIRVPERPAGFEVPLEQMLGMMDRTVGPERMKVLRSQFRVWERCGGESGIEEWRQRMLGRMFSLSEFMKALKQRFSQWYNRRKGRTGVLWEGRYKSVIVEDETKALRTMATYIDLNPVRAGITEDPADYRWSGYAEAMAGKTAALEGIALVTGATAERMLGRALGEAAPEENAGQRKRRHLKALVHYRQLLGIAGRPRVKDDGTVVRRGVSLKVQERLAQESGVRREQLLKRVRHFTDGVVLGSREFINGWFEQNRSWFGGKSSEARKSGARRIGKDWKELYNLRQLGEEGAREPSALITDTGPHIPPAPFSEG